MDHLIALRFKTDSLVEFGLTPAFMEARNAVKEARLARSNLLKAKSSHRYQTAHQKHEYARQALLAQDKHTAELKNALGRAHTQRDRASKQKPWLIMGSIAAGASATAGAGLGIRGAIKRRADQQGA